MLTITQYTILQEYENFLLVSENANTLKKISSAINTVQKEANNLPGMNELKTIFSEYNEFFSKITKFHDKSSLAQIKVAYNSISDKLGICMHKLEQGVATLGEIPALVNLRKLYNTMMDNVEKRKIETLKSI